MLGPGLANMTLQEHKISAHRNGGPKMISLHIVFTLLVFVPVWFLGNQALDLVVQNNQAAHTVLNILLISGFVIGTELFLSASS